MANTGGLNSIGVSVSAKNYKVNTNTNLQKLEGVTLNYQTNEYKVNEYNSDNYNDVGSVSPTLEELRQEQTNAQTNTAKPIITNQYTYEKTWWEELNYGACRKVSEFANDFDRWLENSGPGVDYACTIIQSFSTGVVDVFESAGDGIIQTGGNVIAEIADFFGNEEVAEYVKEITKGAVERDYTGELYDANMKTLKVDEEIAYGTAHNLSFMAGKIWCTVTMFMTIGKAQGNPSPSIFKFGSSKVAAKPLFSKTTGGLLTRLFNATTSAGESSEVAYQSGATFEDVETVSTASALFGWITGSVSDKASAAMLESTTKAQIFKHGIKSTLISMSEPIMNSVTEYWTYGKDIINDVGEKAYNNYLEYYVGSGGLVNTVFAGITDAGGLAGRMFGDVKFKFKNKINSVIGDAKNLFKNNSGGMDLGAINNKKVDIGNNKGIKNIKTLISEETKNAIKGNTVEDNIYEILKRHDAKYGDGNALTRLYEFVNPNSKHYRNYDIISSVNDARDILKKYSPEQIYHAMVNLSYTPKTNNYSGFFSKYGSSANFNYGVDQGGIAALCEYTYDGNKYNYREAMKICNESLDNGTGLPHFKKEGNPEYFYLKDKLINQGFSSKDASIIMSTVDDAGACSYAATANEIFASFDGKELEFQQKFGYPMYKMENGKKVLNSNELLLDLYVYCNKAENGGGFILNGNRLNPYLLKNNRFDVLGRQMLDADQQAYMSELYSGKNALAISKFLNSKGVNYDSKWLFTNPNGYAIDDSLFNSCVNQVSNEINSGNVVSMDIFQFADYNGNFTSAEIHMNSSNPNLYSSMSTRNWNEGGGHAIFVTGVGSDCFYVSSWGREYSIPFDDLKNGGVFNFYSANIY